MNAIVSKLKQLPKNSGLKFSPDGTRAWIRCVFHKLKDGSQEHTQSLMINITKNGPFKPGTGVCHACGEFVPELGKIFDPVGWRNNKGIEHEEDAFVYNLYDETTNKLLFEEDENVTEKMPNALPWNPEDDWRTVRGILVKKVGGRLIYDAEYNNMMLYLPCKVNGEHIGGIRANLEKRGKRNYFNTAGGWVKRNGLYPYDFTRKFIKAKGLRTLVAVEGPRDALKSLQYGIPAMGILGTGNWSEEKADLIANLDIDRIITAFDPDASGERASKKLKESLGGEIDVFRFDFAKYQEGDKKLDPGNSPAHVMKKLRSYVI